MIFRFSILMLVLSSLVIVNTRLSRMQAVARPAYLTKETEFLQERVACPDDLEILTVLLLRDLPGYANRVSTRARNDERVYEPKSVVVLAGQPELSEVAPGLVENVPSPEEIERNGLEQIFFTTLARQYTDDAVVRLQHYHWVFLAQTDDGWRLSLMFSRIGDYPDQEPPSPLYESSEGVIGNAVQLWLRDCRAGAIAPLADQDDDFLNEEILNEDL